MGQCDLVGPHKHDRLFTSWLNAYSTHETELAGIYEKRFRDEFRPIFKAWLATDPFNNPNAPAGPLLMPEYHLELSDKADKLAQDSAKLPLDEIDQCPEDLFNRILWHAMKGSRAPYPEWAITMHDDDDD